MPIAKSSSKNGSQYGWLLLLLVLLLSWILKPDKSEVYEIPYSEFKNLLIAGDVELVTLYDSAIDGQLKQARVLSSSAEAVQYFKTRVPIFGDPDLLPLCEQHHVKLRVKPGEQAGWLQTLITALLPWVLLIAFYIWFLRRLSGDSIKGNGPLRGGGVARFLNPTAGIEDKILETTFADVAGQDNAKREVSELLDYIRHPEQYKKLGAEVPHGVLLMGPPGTGKTLLARALAGEAGVSFCSVSASEFIEMFVGVGAARVRELFMQARKRAPSIIFIDELDAVGRVRGAGLGGGHDEREQTLNQILAEMDGFSGHEAVIVLAATNRPDVLDPALLRPGRFDRHVTLDLPDRNARTAILRLHARLSPLADDVDFEKIAAGTPGFSGADLKNLVNEAAMRAAREKRDEITMEDFDQMRDKVLLGSKRSLIIQPEEQHRLAVHESGHTTVAYFLPHSDPLFKVTIIPRGRALGGTQQLPEEERYTLAQDYLLDRLAVILGGRAAEKILLDSVSSGADDDIRQATALARSMVTRWGMSEQVGPMDLRESEEHPFLGREIAQPRMHSEASAKLIDQAISQLLRHAEDRAADVIQQHRQEMEQLVKALVRHETLYREQITECLGIVHPNISEHRAERCVNG